jgi:adenine-specific DNA-methyltransferase
MIPVEKKFFMRRINSLKNVVGRCDAGPSIATKALLCLWQKDKYPLLMPDLQGNISEYWENHEIIELATWLSNRPFLEASFWLSTAYAMWVGNGVRNEMSLYFTPPALAERLIDNLISNGASLTDHTWMDPACGGGAFLAPAAVRMVNIMTDQGADSAEIVKRVSKNLIGNDIDETLADLAKQFLLMALYDHIVISKQWPEFNICVGNGLLENSEYKQVADVVICNPPYRKLKSEEVVFYSDLFGDVIEGQSNVYALFIKKCLEFGKHQSIIGLLTPTSYLSGKHFSNLRKKILAESSVCQLDMIDDRSGIFIGVSQIAVLSVFKRSGNEFPKLNFTDVFTLSKTGTFTSVGQCQLSSNSNAWIVPRESGDQEVIDLAFTSPYRLIDYGYVARIGAYVDYRDTRETFKIFPEKDDASLIFPIIWSSDITTDGRLVHGRTSAVDQHPIFIKMDDPLNRSIIRKEVIVLQRVTSPDQERRLICAPLCYNLLEKYGGVVGENHVIFIEKVKDDMAIPINKLIAILSSKPVDRLFRTISGAVNVSISEINQLPLPNPNAIAIAITNAIEDSNDINAAILEAYKHP